ncbi:MAG: alpha/beta hydrolase [candidate division Zixibacteria bacterium]|nr:alpha/beta hydrolase [candidate division Zixibacteria bacterium]
MRGLRLSRHAALVIALAATAVGNVRSQMGTLANGSKTVTLNDSLKMRLEIDQSRSALQPTFICLPMMGNSTTSYEPLLHKLVAVVAADTTHTFQLPRLIRMDLRGHGQSNVLGSDTVNFRTMNESEFAKYPYDAKHALEQLFRDFPGQIDTANLTVIGASIGANTAAMLTQLMPNIKRLVLLSPGINYKGLQPAEAITSFQGEILMVASQGDEYSYNSVREMARLNSDHVTLMIFEGDAHGTDMINSNPQAMQALVDWLLK